MYRHRAEKGLNQQNITVSGDKTGGWKVLPIQNAIQAAVKPRDWAALNNLSCKWRIKNFSVECTNFNAQEFRASTTQIVNETIPNIFLECYVDTDKDLPGYEEDFLLKYGTNNLYSTGDGSLGDDPGKEDYDLKPWVRSNETGPIGSLSPIVNLHLYDGRGLKFIKQTDDFRFVWYVAEGQRRWRHAYSPWQFQVNPEFMQSNYDGYENFSSGGLMNANLSWGGFPGGRSRTPNIYPAELSQLNSQTDFKGDFTATAQRVARSTAGKGLTVAADGVVSGRAFPFVSYYKYTDKEGATKYKRLYNAYDGAAYNQITGVPEFNDPPPLIMFRVNNRKGVESCTWEFYCKYTCTIEYRRNQFAYDPLPINANTVTTHWCGTGNIGFTSVPGAGRYSNDQDPFGRQRQPFGKPYRPEDNV